MTKNSFSLVEVKALWMRGYGRLTLPRVFEAIEPAVRADKELPIGNGDARTSIVVPFFAHGRRAKNLERFARAEHENVAPKVHHINPAIRAGRGCLDFG